MAANDKTNSTATVTVGCKLPHGFHLALHGEPDASGNRPELDRYTVAGANASEIIGGHGITPGIPKDFWDEWLRRNKNTPMVRNGLIFADESAARVAGEANSRKENETGFEGIDPKKPGKGVGDVQPQDGKA